MIQNSGSIYENVFKLLGEGKKRTLLDIGGGSGDFVVHAYTNGFKSSMCGYEMMEYNEHIPFEHIDLNNDFLPYDKNSFDVVTALELIEHIFNPFGLIEEINKILKRGGTFILSTPNVQSWYQRLYYIFTGKLLGFDQKDGYTFDHISPLHWQIFQPYLEKYFIIEEISCNRSIIPILKIQLPFKGMFWSDSLIIRMRKK